MGVLMQCESDRRNGGHSPRGGGATQPTKCSPPAAGSPGRRSPPVGLGGLPHWRDGGPPLLQLAHAEGEAWEYPPRDGESYRGAPPMPTVVGPEQHVPPPEYWQSIQHAANQLRWDAELVRDATYEVHPHDYCQMWKASPLVWGGVQYRYQDDDRPDDLIAFQVASPHRTSRRRFSIALAAERLRRWGYHGPWKKEPFDHADWQDKRRAEHEYRRITLERDAALNPRGEQTARWRNPEPQCDHLLPLVGPAKTRWLLTQSNAAWLQPLQEEDVRQWELADAYRAQERRRWSGGPAGTKTPVLVD